MRKILMGATAVIVSLAMAIPALAAESLFGDATVANGSVTLVSDATPGWGGIALDDANGLTFSNLTTLSADFNATDDGCAGGSPRFQINVDVGGGDVRNIFAYMGTEPNYTCALNTWTNSTNVVGGTRFIDTSQLPGGTFYDTYAHALATYGSYPITGIQVVVDSGWAFTDGEQTVLIDNITINASTHTFTLKDSCKDGGWQTLGFKNQGSCVASVVSQNPN